MFRRFETLILEKVSARSQSIVKGELREKFCRTDFGHLMIRETIFVLV